MGSILAGLGLQPSDSNVHGSVSGRVIAGRRVNGRRRRDPRSTFFLDRKSERDDGDGVDNDGCSDGSDEVSNQRNLDIAVPGQELDHRIRGSRRVAAVSGRSLVSQNEEDQVNDQS